MWCELFFTGLRLFTNVDAGEDQFCDLSCVVCPVL